MIFNSFGFAFFYLIVLLLVVVVHKCVRHNGIENALLLVASYAFYGSFNIAFLLCLIYITVLNYSAGLILSKRKSKLSIGLIVTLSLIPLATFKYSRFIFSDILGIVAPTAFGNWIAPVGISFFTFQALSYSIDLYRGKIARYNNIVEFALFVAFFPTLLSGPIERARNLLPQIATRRDITIEKLFSAFAIFSYGLFKKIVVADRLAAYVNNIYATPTSFSSATLAFAAVLYSVQIYCDFSGYSDMAIGIARGLGFNITQNFRFPYFATSFKDFWHRWHISLTSWFTEYVYFSLGGNRVKTRARWMLNISIIFILSGIWHGAAWGFLAWGAMHAALYLSEHLLGIQRKEFAPALWFKLMYALVVFAFVTLAWIFFRADSIHNATTIISGIFTHGGANIYVGASTFTFLCNIFLLTTFIISEILLCYKKTYFERNSVRVVALASLWIFICMFAVASDSFVYFQF